MTGEGATRGPEGLDPTRSVDLVARFQHGDAAAANELFTRYIPRMKRVLRVMVGSAPRAQLDPDDLLQETLIVAVRRLAELEVRSPDAILCWLKRIAELELKNQLQRLHAQKRDPGRERSLDAGPASGDSPCLALPAADPTPSQVYAREEMEHIVDRAIHELEPTDYREVILLRDYCQADWEHIRTSLGRPSVAAAQDLYHRAHERLRARLGRLRG